MKIESQAKIIVETGAQNTGLSPEEVILAVENHLNDELTTIPICCANASQIYVGIRVHLKGRPTFKQE